MDIPLGAKGRLHGVEWEVTGFIVNSYSATIYWKEYQLSNPFKGTRWLTEIDGHWNYVVELHHAPASVGSDKIHYLDKDYKLFHKSHGMVVHLEGQFDFDIRRGARSEYQEYISPPFIITYESERISNRESEESWFLGEHVDKKTLENAFSCDLSMVSRSGVSPNQPCPYKKNFGGVFAVFAASLALFLFPLVLLALWIEPRVAAQFEQVIPEGKGEIASHSFQLDSSAGVTQLQFHAPNLSDSWAEIDFALVNTNTGVSYTVDTGLEYYYGSDWSEGSRTKTISLSSLPNGNYTFLANTEALRRTQLEIRIDDGVILFRDILFAFFLIALFPLFLLLFGYVFEQRRWSESDYSPYYRFFE